MTGRPAGQQDWLPRWIAGLGWNRSMPPSSSFTHWEAPTQGVDRFVPRHGRIIARARVLLALGNLLVVSLTPIPLPSRDEALLARAYGAVLLFLVYSLWVWRTEDLRRPAASLARLTPWLDALCSSALIWSTGGHASPFDVWNVFTIVACALRNGWATASRVALLLIALYISICLPGPEHADVVLGACLMQMGSLFAVALVLAYVGQRLLEQNRTLTSLHAAERHLTAGCAIPDLLGRIADSLVELVEAEQVAVATWVGGSTTPLHALVNLSREQGERLLAAIRDCMASVSPDDRAVTILCDDPGTDARFSSAGEALLGVRSLLVTRLPRRTDHASVLVACDRSGGRHFTQAEVDAVELLAAHAGALLEMTALQDQRRYHASADERRRIAAELHDGMMQTLAALDLQILNCTELCRRGQQEALGAELVLLKRLTEETLREARGVLNDLAPVRLREEGLPVFLEDCIQRFQEATSVRVEASIDLAETEVPEPTALLLIGLLREGLNNIRKHAHASRVVLAITRDDSGIGFRLADDGVGFEADQCQARGASTRHYGLFYLRERIAAVGGTLRVTARPGVGTEVEARIPLRTEDRPMALLS
jgi:signal transduction histidine kinase